MKFLSEKVVINMAHWKIDDHGFGGMYYTCSDCGASFWDILDRFDTDTCPKCGMPMDEDGVEYFRNGKPERADVYDPDFKLNAIVADIMSDWRRLLTKVKSHGMDIRLTPNSTNSLELYFHNDYPDLILVDKEDEE